MVGVAEESDFDSAHVPHVVGGEHEFSALAVAQIVVHVGADLGGVQRPEQVLHHFFVVHDLPVAGQVEVVVQSV